jgi:hypothetical protein
MMYAMQYSELYTICKSRNVMRNEFCEVMPLVPLSHVVRETPSDGVGAITGSSQWLIN